MAYLVFNELDFSTMKRAYEKLKNKQVSSEEEHNKKQKSLSNMEKMYSEKAKSHNMETSYSSPFNVHNRLLGERRHNYGSSLKQYSQPKKFYQLSPSSKGYGGGNPDKFSLLKNVNPDIKAKKLLH